MRIAVDVDDVVLDMVPEWCKLYNEEYSDNLSPTDIRSWDMTRYVVKQCGNDIYKYIKNPNLYDFVVPVSGALTSTKFLQEIGHELIYITIDHNEGKLNSLKKFGFVDEKGNNYVVARDKNLIGADILIDDSPDNIANFRSKAILFTRPWNESFDISDKPNVVRCHGWTEAVSLIAKMAYVTRVEGIGKEVPTVVNKNGGKQSALNYRFDLFDPLVIFNVSEILYEGAEKYGEWNWRRISVEENVNHALSHVFAYMAGDEQDDHIGHAICRLMFAQSLLLTPGEDPRMTPKEPETIEDEDVVMGTF